MPKSPALVLLLSAILVFPASAAVTNASFDRAAPSLSLSIAVDSPNFSLAIPAGLTDSLSAGEFASTPATLALALNQSATLDLPSGETLYSAEGGLAQVFPDGCSDSDHGGADECALAGFTGPGTFQWCSACDYFHPDCGGSLYRDYCYRYYPAASGNATSNATVTNFSFSILAAAGDSSCTATPGLGCASAGISVSISDYYVNLSAARIAFIRQGGNGSWHSVPPSSLDSYRAALSSYNSRFSVSIPEAASASAALNAALAALLNSASGDYSPPFKYSIPTQAAFPNVSVTLSNPALALSPVRGRPFLPPAGSSPRSDANGSYFAVPARNDGFIADSFLVSISCNDSSGANFTSSLDASAEAVLRLPAVNFTPPRSCAVFAQSSLEPRLNASEAVEFDAFLPACPPGFQCCPAGAFLERPCGSVERFNDSGGFYYRQDFACEDFSCAEAGSSFLRFPTPPSSGGSASYSSGLPGYGAILAVSPSTTSSPSPSGTPAPSAVPASLAFVSVQLPPAHQLPVVGVVGGESDGIGAATSAVIASGVPAASALPGVSSASSLSVLSASSLKAFIAVLSCALAGLAAYFLSRPKTSLSKRFSGGAVRLRLENRAGPLSAVVLKDFAPADTVFSPPPDGLSDTVLGLLAEWRVGELPAGGRFEASYSCAAPAPRQASAEFTESGRRYSLKSG